MELVKKLLIVILTVAFLFGFYFVLGSRAIVAYNTKNLIYVNQEEPLKIVMKEAEIRRMLMKEH
ncbi:MAG: hypothetical protein L5655_00925 [Thermosediminibacteraceae bacterium]|nr:hypothetical protein [Thermosediminibacteraceae bacterium]